MEPLTVGFIAVAALLILVALRFPIAYGLLMVGTGGLVYLFGLGDAVHYVPFQLYSYLAKFTWLAVPLFLLMGYFVFYTGVSHDAYESARLWVGRLPGGLAVATFAASTLLGAACGSGLASAAALSKIAIPEMIASGYDKRLSVGVVASASSLALLIPPSVLLIIYGVITETSIGKLFIAGIIPGLVFATVCSIGVIVWARLFPASAPTYKESVSWRQRFYAIPKLWGIALLFAVVIGGIYTGLVDATEAAGLGAFVAMVICIALRKLNWSTFKEALLETVSATSMIFLLIVGAGVFTTLMSISGMVELFTNLVISLDFPVWGILGMLVILYVILGTILDTVSMMILTLPFVIPIMVTQDINFLWFGIILIVVTEIGSLTPPMGLTIYVMKGVLGDQISIGEMFQGCLIFILFDLIIIAILIAFPILVTWLPEMMLK